MRKVVAWIIGLLFLAMIAGALVVVAMLAMITGASQVDENGCIPTADGGTVAAFDTGGGSGPAKPAVAAQKALKGGKAIDVAAQAAVRYWDGTDAVTAVAVGGPESGWNPKAQNPGSTAKGIWQTMMSLHAPKYKGGSWSNPLDNARVAHQIWDDAAKGPGGSWSPWVGYTSGAYESYMDEARAAVKRAGGGDEPTLPTPEDVFKQPVTASAAASEKAGPGHTVQGLTPAAARAYGYVRDQWDFKGIIWGYSYRYIAGTSTLSEHASGRAIDVMVNDDQALGNEISAYFRGPGTEEFPTANVIYRQRIANAGTGWQWKPMSDRGSATQNHMDHVHVDFEAGPDRGVAQVSENAVEASCVAEAVVGGATGGAVVYPIAKSADRHNYGGDGAAWAHGHTGTDFSAACGTPVKAAHGGTVVIETGPSWYGDRLIKVTSGPNKLTTWYAHMQSAAVENNQVVEPGDILGEVGNLGNVVKSPGGTGCHLHFEVHPRNGTIYEDKVDPSKWLAAHVGKSIGGGFVKVAATTPSTGPGFTLSTFNVLGSSHTGGRGKHPGMASGPERMKGAMAILNKYDVDVAGFQEFQGNQRDAFIRLGAGKWAEWHAGNDTENAIGWKLSEFRRIGAMSYTIPYFNGQPRRMPIVQLRHKSGQVIFVVNSHNPAETAQFHNQGRFRRTATAAIAGVVQRLTARYGHPVFVTGDMNEHAEFYCQITAQTGLVAAAGGVPNDSGQDCQPPPHDRANIDWMLGPVRTRWSNYVVDDGPLVDRSTDHPFYSVRAQVGATR